jgi:nitrile hydratase beta subunit
VNGVHDMGGMHGFGPVLPEKDEPVFHEPWEARIFAIRGQLARFGGNIDMRRSHIEQIRPDRYLRITYYERWLDTALRYCVEKGLISAAELKDIEAGKPAPENVSHRKVEPDAAPPHKDYARKINSPALFSEGEYVRTRRINPVGHTRLPRYARGKTGTILADRGGFVYPDSNALGRGEDPKRLYTVRFAARELWGSDAHPRDSVCLDLWEPYLERV